MKSLKYGFSLSFHLALIFGLWFKTPHRESMNEVVEIITLTQIPSESNKSFSKVTQKKERKINSSTNIQPPNLLEENSKSIPSNAKLNPSNSLNNDEPISLPIEDISPSQTVGQTDLETTIKGRPPQNSTEKYLAIIRDRIASKQLYPPQSRIFKEEGVVSLKITVQKDGSLAKIEVVQPSPYKRLNDAAIRAVAKAAPFAQFPSDISYEYWIITLPVRFMLSRGQRQKSG